MQRLSAGVARALGSVAALCLAALMFSGSADAIWRLLGARGLRGLVEYGEVLLVALTFLGLAVTQLSGGHVSVDMVTRRLPPRLALTLEMAGLALLLALLTWMVIASGRVAWASFVSGEYRIGLVRAPVWPARAAVPLGIGALALVILSQMRTRLAQWRRLPDEGGAT